MLASARRFVRSVLHEPMVTSSLGIMAPSARPVQNQRVRHGFGAQVQTWALPLATAPRPQAWVTDMEARRVGIVELEADVFNHPVRLDLIQRVLIFERDGARQGTAKVKNRSEVRGSTRKIWNQKGTGRARHSDRGAPQFRGGGKAHGKRPRSFATKLSRNVRELGLKSILSSRFHEDNLQVLKSDEFGEFKTKALTARLPKLDWETSVLVVVGGDINHNFALASRNLPSITVLEASQLTVWEVLKRKKLVLTASALPVLYDRLKVSSTTAPCLIDDNEPSNDDTDEPI